MFLICREMGKVHTNHAGTMNSNSHWTDENDSSASIEEEFCNLTEVLDFFTLPFFMFFGDFNINFSLLVFL
jgi:hypothetical protein